MRGFLTRLLALLTSVRANYAATGEVRLGVLTECIGANGKVKWQDRAAVRRKDLQFRCPPILKFGTYLLIASVTIAGCLYVPEIGWCFPVIGRVTTAGLNQLLDATIKTGVTSPTWFVGLAKQVASDGAITSGSATFTSASGTFVSGDIGRNIIVQGAGAAGADLYTTIVAVGSTTSITLDDNAGTTVSGARYAFECRLADTSASHTSFVESVEYSNATRPAFTPGTIANGSVDNSGSVAAFTIDDTDWIFGAFLINNSTKGGSTGILYGMGVNSSGVARQVLAGDTLNVTITLTNTAV